MQEDVFARFLLSDINKTIFLTSSFLDDTESSPNIEQGVGSGTSPCKIVQTLF